ncbi:phage regulatory CII family protein [Rhizobium wuzhouense]|uniref:XRE family transcriptional regulator n=1 Tax=Rhizobium wuzhouense TaxID=1986026 RepID=A0ABX5NMF6_9HYPH|nr:phage regulatory CII family protein [Rhizobium wuzhouense]PYB71290.1 hypothetical protein DMY87_18200 [Rhizobium wuzhouense]
MRAVSDKDLKTLKAATRLSVTRAGGSDAFEHVTRVRQGQISKYGLASDEHMASFMPIDVALEADIEGGSPVIVEAMAKLLGYRLVREDVPEPETGLTHRDISALNAEAGDVTRLAIEALDDGRLDAREKRDLMEQLAELKAQIAAVEGKIGGGA